MASTADHSPAVGWELQEAAADLLLGRTCAGCRRPGPLVCAECRVWLDGYGPRLVRPRPSPPGLPMTVASAPYAGPMRGIVHRYKEASAWGLADLLAERAALSVLGLLHRVLEDGLWSVGPVVLVPAPSRRQAVLARGSDVTARFTTLAARQVASALGVPVACRRIVRMGVRTVDQAGLDAAERRVNLGGSLVLCGGTERSSATVIVDDVVTTGSTLAELARVLREGGIRPVGAATVAATPRTRESGLRQSDAHGPP